MDKYCLQIIDKRNFSKSNNEYKDVGFTPFNSGYATISGLLEDAIRSDLNVDDYYYRIVKRVRTTVDEVL